jgi:hypothetical protein
MDTLERIKIFSVLGIEKTFLGNPAHGLRLTNCDHTCTKVTYKVAIGDFGYDKDEGSYSIKMNLSRPYTLRSSNKLLFPVGKFRAKLKQQGNADSHCAAGKYR